MRSPAIFRRAAAVLALTLASGAVVGEQAAPAPTATPPSFFVVLFRTGPGWDPAKAPNAQAFMREHSENLRSLRDEKKIPMGGRYSDVGLVLLSAASEAEARSWIDRDPAVKNGTFVFELHAFRPFMTGCVGKSE